MQRCREAPENQEEVVGRLSTGRGECEGQSPPFPMAVLFAFSLRAKSSVIYRGLGGCDPAFGCTDTPSRVELGGMFQTLVLGESGSPARFPMAPLCISASAAGIFLVMKERIFRGSCLMTPWRFQRLGHLPPQCISRAALRPGSAPVCWFLETS